MKTAEFLKKYPEHEEEFIERAGIFQHGAEMYRIEAEEKAIKYLEKKYSLYGQSGLFSDRRQNNPCVWI